MKHVLIVAALLLIGSVGSRACDCISATLERSASDATHVFYGEVTAISDKNEQTKNVLFQVAEWFKGPKQERDSISLRTSGTDCDLYFQVGEKWLIFASGEPLVAMQCDGSRRLEPSPRER